MSHIYKKFVNERAAALIDKTTRIRNCTVIAHIDHGKTTLTDSLIAASGLLSKEVAATARLLDYDMIEQERGITIKASGISLIHELDGQDYLIHLIDTPGHIDFSSHVTRGLRLTDGAIIVVDVIEGIMVQTETVSRQAMSELVRPVLFINKVDRLINERRLGAKRVAGEINKTVREFNAMLGKYLGDDSLERWEVSFSKSSLCVGSALDKWGLDLSVLKEASGGSENARDLANAFIEILEEIVESYSKEEEGILAQKYPVAKVILDSVVKTIPNPSIAQSYRLPIFWTQQGNEHDKRLLECNSDGPAVLLVGDVQPDRHAGLVAAVRVFAGTLHRAEPLVNLRTGGEGKTLQVGIFMSKSRIALPKVPAGNLAFITGIKHIAVADTLVSKGAQGISPMMELEYPTEPVVTYSIEPKKLSQLNEIQELISQYAITDPALEFEVNPETGEMLLSGAGELHIEISIEKLARQGIEIVLGKPMVLLKEQMTRDGISCIAGDESTSIFSVRAILLEEGFKMDDYGTLLDSEPMGGCYIFDSTGQINLYGEEIEWIREAFRSLVRNGPSSGEKLRQLAIIIEKAQLRFEAPETSWRDVTIPLIQAMRCSVKSGNPQTLEPWVRLEISTPEEHVGELTAILSRRKGRVHEIDSERALYRISAEIPVQQSFGLAREIRTSTSGWATWGAKPGGYRKVGADEDEEPVY
ncbi:MAG: GTP-binding protein [Candidatus Thorarchaeota archaeon]